MKDIKLLGIPFHFGQPHPGVQEAPDALRAFGLLERLGKYARVRDLGDIDFGLVNGESDELFIRRGKSNSLANELISNCIEGEDLSQSFLLNVGGDHGLALGTIHGILAHRPDTTVFWADAHGDINTPETSLSGNFHGMPLSYLLKEVRSSYGFSWLKRTLRAKRLVLFGPRDLDKEELKIIEALNIQYYSSRLINYYGAQEIVPLALDIADHSKRSAIHLSFDVDLFDQLEVKATGTRVPDGPRTHEVFHMARLLGETGRLRSMDLVEINPKLDSPEEVSRTLALASELAEESIRSTFVKFLQGDYESTVRIA